MTLNDVPENRMELDKAERAQAADRRAWLLSRLGPKAKGLRCWAFGLGWESRSLDEIPCSKIAEFAEKYA